MDDEHDAAMEMSRDELLALLAAGTPVEVAKSPPPAFYAVWSGPGEHNTFTDCHVGTEQR